MRLSGFDDEARSSWGIAEGYGQAGGIDQESPVNYMCAQYLIWSVRDRFTTEISALSGISDGSELKGPNLTYQKAVQLVKNWESNRSASGITGQMDRAVEKRADKAKAETARIAKLTNHGASAEKTTSSSMATLSGPSKESTEEPGIHPRYSAFLKRNPCELCKKTGHVGSKCPDTAYTDEQKEACRDSYISKKIEKRKR